MSGLDPLAEKVLTTAAAHQMAFEPIKKAFDGFMEAVNDKTTICCGCKCCQFVRDTPEAQKFVDQLIEKVKADKARPKP